MQHNAGGTLSHLSAQTIKNTHTHTAVAEKGGGIVRGGREIVRQLFGFPLQSAILSAVMQFPDQQQCTIASLRTGSRRELKFAAIYTGRHKAQVFLAARVVAFMFFIEHCQ